MNTEPIGEHPRLETSDALRLPRVGVWEHHLPENRVVLSGGFCQMAGLEAVHGEANPRFWTQLLHPDDSERMLGAYAAFVAGAGEEFECQYRIRHQDGHWMSVLSRARWERRDGPGAGLICGHVMDVSFTDRLRMQSQIIERLTEGVLLVSRDGIIRFANTVFAATLGYPPEEIIGRHARTLSFRSEAAFDGLIEAVFEATANGGSAVIDMEGRRRDGLLIPLQGRFSALTLQDIPHVVGLFNDITALKQMEREVMQMATQVQQRVGGDLHEGLSQQLSGIAMMLASLKARADVVTTTVLHQELDELVKLVNSAVTRTRLLARGLSPVRPSAKGITEGFEELVNTVHRVYGLDVQLEMDLPDNLVVDENSVMNLFHIAQEAVENAARHAGARSIRMVLRAAGPDLELQVEDDGVGFDPAYAGAAGMGMRMMRFRAEMARGYLSIESRPGQGARLRCRCPAIAEAR